MEFDLLFTLCAIAFCAGFIDSIVGGGGLIQTPLTLALVPQVPIATLIGTLKVPALTGTSLATYTFLKKVKIDWKLFSIMAILAFISAFVGSQLLTVVSNEFMKPLLLVILIALAIYTIFKKDFGQAKERAIPYHRILINACIISIVVGFYDGFIGPATGTFFILGFVTLLGMDFLQANTNAKMVNLATNLGSICLFLIKGKIIWSIALPMAFFNGLGGIIGARMAVSKGNHFIRYFFIFVISLSICRFGYEVIRDLWV